MGIVPMTEIDSVSFAAVAKKIPLGEKNALSIEELECLLHDTARGMRYLIYHLRLDGFIIHSDEAETRFWRPLPDEVFRDRPRECAFPKKQGCRGCVYSFTPRLYDGGCILLSNALKRAKQTAN